METRKRLQVQQAAAPGPGKSRLEILLSGDSTMSPGEPVAGESGMDATSQKWIDVSGWSVEQVHDALKRHGRDGWELSRVIEASTGRMVLCLVLREVA